MMETEAAREPEERETEKRSLSLEDLRRKYSWWRSGHGKEGSADPPPKRGSRGRRQCNVEVGEDHESLSVK